MESRLETCLDGAQDDSWSSNPFRPHDLSRFQQLWDDIVSEEQGTVSDHEQFGDTRQGSHGTAGDAGLDELENRGFAPGPPEAFADGSALGNCPSTQPLIGATAIDGWNSLDLFPSSSIPFELDIGKTTIESTCSSPPQQPSDLPYAIPFANDSWPATCLDTAIDTSTMVNSSNPSLPFSDFQFPSLDTVKIVDPPARPTADTACDLGILSANEDRYLHSADIFQDPDYPFTLPFARETASFKFPPQKETAGEMILPVDSWVRQQPTPTATKDPLESATQSFMTPIPKTEMVFEHNPNKRRRTEPSLPFDHTYGLGVDPLSLSFRSRSFPRGSEPNHYPIPSHSPITSGGILPKAGLSSPFHRRRSRIKEGRVQPAVAIQSIDDFETAMAGVLQTFHKDMTDLLNRTPIDVLFPDVPSGDTTKQTRIDNIAKTIQMLQKACSTLNNGKRPGADERRRSSVIHLPSPLETPYIRHAHRESIASNISVKTAPPSHPISAARQSTDDTTVAKQVMMPPKHEYPAGFSKPLSTSNALPIPQRPAPMTTSKAVAKTIATILGSSSSLDPASLITALSPARPSDQKQSCDSVSPMAKHDCAVLQSTDQLMGPWHRVEIDRLCHYWWTSKQNWLIKQGISIPEWCAGIPDKFKFNKLLAPSPAYQEIIRFASEWTSSRRMSTAAEAEVALPPTLVLPRTAIWDHEATKLVTQYQPLASFLGRQSATSGDGDDSIGSDGFEQSVPPTWQPGNDDTPRNRIDEGVDWDWVCANLGIQRSKTQIIFRAIEWGLKGDLNGCLDALEAADNPR
ncbi:hypothetical protein BD324DRAFT_680694 [Kockovaella imperatae]|uniref:Uncharacterized protein n=1 Tax=Kockovaella imperatae TaxID=4999 RepID=A0A1Y1UL36_9TREE|nr:hypothetical protein BD324DRAFT_680694 [Kockovaella imperatae]ORX37815.1 hypothetical protein BD324DRAFT_680694 [Kockovaella imperatae]